MNTKMQTKKAKRGFTITELVIVIAVIAILAAVLIPTFSNVINRANESAAMQEARNEWVNFSSSETVATDDSDTKNYLVVLEKDGEDPVYFIVENGQFNPDELATEDLSLTTNPKTVKSQETESLTYNVAADAASPADYVVDNEDVTFYALTAPGAGA